MKREILADLHVHSQFSDGKLSISELVDFYGSRGFGCIAITDHICEETHFLGKVASYLEKTLTQSTFAFYMAEIEKEAARAWDQYEMLVIPGFELTKNSLFNQRSAHILGLGIQSYVRPDEDVLELLQTVRNQGAITVAAHPVSTRKLEPQTYHLWSRQEELNPFVDAWEVASGPTLFEEVKKSRLPKIATSDLHHPKQINAWKTILHCEKHPQAVLAAIRNQELRFTFYSEPTFHLSTYKITRPYQEKMHAI